MRKPSVFLVWLVLGLAVISATSVNAYVLFDFRWPSATTTFNVDIPGGDGLWNTAFEQAMALWSVATIFEFKIMRTLEHPCDGLPTRQTSDGDFENGVAFVSDLCGEAFGDNTIASTSSWSKGTRLIQSNIHFNNAYSWNVYDGSYKTGQMAGVEDFRRVAVHELGHALGLAHEDDVPAIMLTEQRRGNTIVAPQADDIAGVLALYGDATPPPPPPSPSNDRFSNATRISGPSGRATGSNVNATGESGEPGSGSKSVWWQWRSPSSGVATIDTAGSSFNTILSVYTGTRVDRLTELAENKDALGQQSRVTLRVTAGTVYWLRVSGMGSIFGGGGTGDIVLNWNLETAGAAAQHQYIFPQFAFGGGWRSTLTVVTDLDDITTCTFSAQGRFLTMRDARGNLHAGRELTLRGTFNLLKTENKSMEASSGMAVLNCDKEVISANTLFSLEVGGSLVGEALVEPSEEVVAAPGTFAWFPADHRDGARFGVAVANPSNQAMEVQVVATDLDLADLVNATVNVPANSAEAFFIDDLGTIPAGQVAQVLILPSNIPGPSVYVVGLRFFRTGVFTTIPATVFPN